MTAPSASILLFVGTMTRETAGHFAGACGEGIVAFAFDPNRGTLQRRSVYRGICSPSYLACAALQGRLFAVECTFDAPGRLCSFAFDEAGSLSLVDARPANGRAACHVCLHPRGQLLYTASYMGACIDTFRARDGILGPPVTQTYRGSGPHASRQEAAHAHQVALDREGRRLYVCDLGSDRVWIHELDAGSPSGAVGHAKMPDGSGPRHLVFHPALPLAYVVNELTGRLITCACDPTCGDLRALHDSSGLPAHWRGTPSAAAVCIHPSRKALFVSQRNHHSVTVYQLNSEGIPQISEHLPSGGCEPRDLAIDPGGRWMIVANQNSHNLAIFELDPVTGLPSGRAAGSETVNSPACIVFAG